jgi:hypothetical protein
MRWGVVLLWAFAVFAAADAAADTPRQGGLSDAVQIRVWSVHATNKTNQMDERLGRVAKHLKSLSYSGFELLQKDAAGVSVKGARRFQIAGDRTVRVTVLSRNDKRSRVRVQVKSAKGALLDTTVSIRRNGFFIVAGPRYKGGILVLPIFARY